MCLTGEAILLGTVSYQVGFKDGVPYMSEIGLMDDIFSMKKVAALTY